MEIVTSLLEWIMSSYAVLIGFAVIGILYLIDLYANTQSEACEPIYDYSLCNGPHIWDKLYRDANGRRQSPINVNTYAAINVPIETCRQLFFGPSYHFPPSTMTLFNNGHNIIIDATWGPDLRPILKGGPLLHDYVFGNVTLRWGPTDDEGSEHMLDAKRYAMEMQLSFIKIENEVMPLRVNVLNAAKNGDLAYVSYFFMVTPVDNPYMEQIVNNLENVKSVYASVNIEPMPLSLLAPGFNRKYLTYEGSLTYPPCTEGVLWILQPEALTISRRQMKKFRKLTGANGLILNNTRPVQNLHERNILFYD